MQANKLYSQLLEEASKFNSYYYRNYFTRKIKTLFAREDEKTVEKANHLLAVLKRQTVISNLYSDSKLVIESDKQSK